MLAALSAEIEMASRDIEHARGLPNACYTDPSLFESERDRVFSAGWAGVGFAKDVPNAGDAKPLTFLGVPLLLVRDRDDSVRVYQNTCRHRGMILVDAPTHLKGVIRCPYHSWCYGLDGSLKGTPHVGGPGHNAHDAIDPAQTGLIEFRAEVWFGVVFVNMSGDARDFKDYCGDLHSRWQEFDHPLNTYSRLEDHYNILAENHYSGQGTMVYRPTLSDDGRRFSDFPDLSDKWDAGAEYITVYPNVLLGVHRDHTFAIVLEPLETGSTREHIEIFYPSAASTGDDYADLRQANTAMWKTVFEEDIDVVEGMQRAAAKGHALTAGYSRR